MTMFRSVLLYLVSLTSRAGALDIILDYVKCNRSLPLYLADNLLTMDCNGKQRCTLGSETTLKGDLVYKGVNDIGLEDDYAFVSADLDFVGLQFDLLQYLQVPMCGDYIVADENNENDECPEDGLYGFYMPYTLPVPQQENDLTWVVSGFGGKGEIQIFSEANNIDSLMGSCQLYLSTAVTPSQSNSLLGKIPVPTAMISAAVIVAFTAFLVLICMCRAMRDCLTGKKGITKKRRARKNKQQTEDEEDSHAGETTCFTAMID